MVPPKNAGSPPGSDLRLRLDEILAVARERQRLGQSVNLILEARLELRDLAAVQYQLAAAVLEEVVGLSRDSVAAELLALGIEAVLCSEPQALINSAADVADPVDASPPLLN